MDERLKRVIELTAQLKEAVNACRDIVISADVSKFQDDIWGVHVTRPETRSLGPLSPKFLSGDGSWMGTTVDGVPVYGKTDDRTGGEKNE